MITSAILSYCSPLKALKFKPTAFKRMAVASKADAYTELFDFSLRLTSDELVKRQEV